MALIMFSADSRGNDGGAAVMQDCAGGALLCLCGRRYQWFWRWMQYSLSTTATTGTGENATHTHTHTHTHTQVCFCELWGHSIGIMVFILYKPYFLSPYTYPLQQTWALYSPQATSGPLAILDRPAWGNSWIKSQSQIGVIRCTKYHFHFQGNSFVSW